MWDLTRDVRTKLTALKLNDSHGKRKKGWQTKRYRLRIIIFILYLLLFSMCHVYVTNKRFLSFVYIIWKPLHHYMSYHQNHYIKFFSDTQTLFSPRLELASWTSLFVGHRRIVPNSQMFSGRDQVSGREGVRQTAAVHQRRVPAVCHRVRARSHRSARAGNRPRQREYIINILAIGCEGRQRQ